VGWRNFMDKQLSSNKSIEQMSPEQKKQAVDRGVKFAPIAGYVFGVIGPFGAAVIVAAVFLGIFNLFAGTMLQFKTSLGIVAYSWMPGFIGGLIGIVVIFLKPPEAVDLNNLVASNLGALVSGDSPKWLQALGTSLDIFTFWTMFLMALGFSAANPKKLPFGKALGFVLAAWAVFVAIKVGWAAAFS
jgi:Yip1 domain